MEATRTHACRCASARRQARSSKTDRARRGPLIAVAIGVLVIARPLPDRRARADALPGIAPHPRAGRPDARDQRAHRVAAVRRARRRALDRRAGVGAARRHRTMDAATRVGAPGGAVAARHGRAGVRVRQRAVRARSADARVHRARDPDVPDRRADREPDRDHHDAPGVRLQRRHPDRTPARRLSRSRTSSAGSTAATPTRTGCSPTASATRATSSSTSPAAAGAAASRSS